MAHHTNEKCAHPSCACPAAPDSKFCGTWCEGQADNLDITCGCEHAGCSATAGSAA